MLWIVTHSFTNSIFLFSYEYGRSGNPSRDCLEKCLAALDGAEYALAFSSGLAATSTITHLLKSGDHVVCMDDLYGGTNRYFRKVRNKIGHI